MSVTEASRLVASGTLAAGVPTVHDVDLGGARGVSLAIKNTGGSNAINSVAIATSPLGGIYTPNAALGTAIGSISPGAVSPSIDGDGLSAKMLRITLNSTSGTTYEIEMRGGF